MIDIYGGMKMGSNALQELIHKIFSDESTRCQFESNPESVVSQYSLTEPEKTAVLNIHTRLGMVTSESTQLAAVIEPRSWWS
jgi:hypothetical protein